MANFTLPVVIEKDEDGYFAVCPSLQGCYTQGDTYEEAAANIEDAIQLCLESLSAGVELAEEGMADYLANLEDYEQRLARGEIHWKAPVESWGPNRREKPLCHSERSEESGGAWVGSATDSSLRSE